MKLSDQILICLDGLRAIAEKVALIERQQVEKVQRNAAVIADYMETRNLRETGDNFGISHERVRQILRVNGVAPKSKEERSKDQARAYEKRRGEIRKRYLERAAALDEKVSALHGAGKRTAEIAEHLAVSLTSANASQKRQGLVPHTRYSGELSKETIRMFDAGESPADIARKLEYPIGSVRQTLWRYGRKVRERQRAKLRATAKIPDDGRQTYSVPEAGKILGLARGAAYRCAASGALPTLRFGRRIVVPKAALTRMLEP